MFCKKTIFEDEWINLFCHRSFVNNQRWLYKLLQLTRELNSLTRETNLNLLLPTLKRPRMTQKEDTGHFRLTTDERSKYETFEGPLV